MSVSPRKRLSWNTYFSGKFFFLRNSQTIGRTEMSTLECPTSASVCCVRPWGSSLKASEERVCTHAVVCGDLSVTLVTGELLSLLYCVSGRSSGGQTMRTDRFWKLFIIPALHRPRCTLNSISTHRHDPPLFIIMTEAWIRSLLPGSILQASDIHKVYYVKI